MLIAFIARPATTINWGNADVSPVASCPMTSTASGINVGAAWVIDVPISVTICIPQPTICGNASTRPELIERTACPADSINRGVAELIELIKAKII